MRLPLLLAPLLLAGLAGCLTADPAGEPPTQTGGGGALGEPSPFLAYHASAQDPERTTWWVFAVRPDGTADRLQYVDDRSAGVRLGQDVQHSVDDARLLLEPRGGNLNRSAGGLVVMVERGSVEPAAMARLRAALDAWPGAPGASLDDPGAEDVVRFRADGGVDVLRFPPARPEHRELLAAFRVAHESLRVEETFASPEGRGPPPEPPECPRIRVEVAPEAFVAGRTLEARAVLENCGAAPLTLGQDACGPFPLWSVDVATPGRGRALPSDGSAGAARVPDPVCEGAPRPIVVAPGANATLLRRWNGTFAECDARGACRHEDAQGEVTVVSYLTGQAYPGHAPVTVLPREAPRTRFVLVAEHHEVNTTSDRPIFADFGPHCAPVRYTQSPDSVTFRVYGEDDFAPPPGVVVRTFLRGPHSEHVASLSSARVDHEPLAPNATISSPFDATMALARVELTGDDVVVDGVRVPPGGVHTVRANATLEREGGTYEIRSTLRFQDVGPAAVLVERVGPCL